MAVFADGLALLGKPITTFGLCSCRKILTRKLAGDISVNYVIIGVGFDRAVWKTWPEGLSRQKQRPKAEVFVVTEAWGPCFSHGMGDHDQILL